MDTRQNVLAGITLLTRGQFQELRDFMEKLQQDDPVGFKILSVSVKVSRAEAVDAIREGRGLLSRIRDQRMQAFLLRRLGAAHRMIGDIDTAENYLLRALELCEGTDDFANLMDIKVDFFHNMFFSAQYDALREQLRKFMPGAKPPWTHYAMYFMAFLEIARGSPNKALNITQDLLKKISDRFYKLGVMEAQGLALRLTGRIDQAQETLMESARGFADARAAYAVFPCAKAVQIARLSGTEMPSGKLIKLCLRLSKKGSLGERAAAEEIKALMNMQEDAAVEPMFEAAQAYHRAYQNMEALLTGLAAAMFAWRAEHPLFPKILRFIARMAFTHPGLKNDPLTGDFWKKVESLMTDVVEERNRNAIEAYLIGGLRMLVRGREIDFSQWHRKKAVLGLMYMLLIPRHRIAGDHLFYLLWPDRHYRERASTGFYAVIHAIRKNLGEPNLLTRKHDFYQLEDVWTDLEELENLVRLADAAQDPEQKEEYLARARELARGELLPEFPYDRHIEEYRRYYRRLRAKIFQQ